MRKLATEIQQELDDLEINIEQEFDELERYKQQESIDSMITKMKGYITRSKFRLTNFKPDEQNLLIKLLLLLNYKNMKPMIKSYAPNRKDPSRRLKDKTSIDNYDFNRKMFYALNKITVNNDITNLKNYFLEKDINFDNHLDINYIKGFFNVFTYILKNIVRTEKNENLRERINKQLSGINIQTQMMITKRPIYIQSYTAYCFEKLRNELLTEIFVYKILNDSIENNHIMLDDIKDFISNILIEKEEKELDIIDEYFYHLLMIEKRNEYESLLEITQEQIKKSNKLLEVPPKYCISNPYIGELDDLTIRKIILEHDKYDEKYKKHLEESTVLLNFFRDFEKINNLGIYDNLESIGSIGYNSGNLIHLKAVFRTVFRSKLYYTDGKPKNNKSVKYDENKRYARNVARQIIRQLRNEVSIHEYNKQDILFLKEIVTRGIMREENLNDRYLLRCEFKNLLDQKVINYSMDLSITNFHLLTQNFHYKILEHFFDLLEL